MDNKELAISLPIIICISIIVIFMMYKLFLFPLEFVRTLLNKSLSFILNISSASILFILAFLILYYDEIKVPSEYGDYIFIAATAFYIISSFKTLVDIIYKISGGADNFWHWKLKAYKLFLILSPYLFLLGSFLLLKYKEEDKVAKNLFITGFILMVFQPLVLYLFYYIPFKNSYNRKKVK